MGCHCYVPEMLFPIHSEHRMRDCRQSYIPETGLMCCDHHHPGVQDQCASYDGSHQGRLMILYASASVPTWSPQLSAAEGPPTEPTPFRRSALTTSMLKMRRRISTNHSSVQNRTLTSRRSSWCPTEPTTRASVRQWHDGPRVSATFFAVCEVSTGPWKEYCGKSRHRGHFAAPSRLYELQSVEFPATNAVLGECLQ